MKALTQPSRLEPRHRRGAPAMVQWRSERSRMLPGVTRGSTHGVVKTKDPLQHLPLRSCQTEDSRSACSGNPKDGPGTIAGAEDGTVRGKTTTAAQRRGIQANMVGAKRPQAPTVARSLVGVAAHRPCPSVDECMGKSCR